MHSGLSVVSWFQERTTQFPLTDRNLSLAVNAVQCSICTNCKYVFISRNWILIEKRILASENVIWEEKFWLAIYGAICCTEQGMLLTIVISETLGKEIIFIKKIFRTITKRNMNKRNNIISVLLLHISSRSTPRNDSFNSLYLSLFATHVTEQKIFICLAFT
jgi:hypothetical protein